MSAIALSSASTAARKGGDSGTAESSQHPKRASAPLGDRERRCSIEKMN
ncbi:hypothetical protein NC997_02215 [Trichocoleus sp. DQ-A2]